MIAVLMGAWALGLIAIAVKWPQRLVPAAVICSVFQAAALVKVGGVAISPYYFTLLLIAVHCVRLRVTAADVFGRNADTRRIVLCAALLVAVCVFGAMVMPFVFAGTPVLSPRLDAEYSAPLAFSTSNVAQCAYVVLNTMLIWYTAQTARTPEAMRGLVRAFVGAGVLVVGFAAYQLVSSFTGIPYPDDILYSNDSFVIQSGTAVADMPRICSTYTEPAGLASFLIPFILFMCGTLESGVAVRGKAALLVLAIVFAVLSTSSTAYLGLGAIGVWAIGRHVIFPFFRGRGSVRAAGGVLLILAAAVAAVAYNDTLRELLRTMVFEKDQSSSYEQRTYSDHFSTDLAVRTWGLGVGLGSNRGSSFLPTLLSTIGVAGTATLTVLAVLLLRPPRTPDRTHRPFAAALVGTLGLALLSGPDFASPSFWALMAALVAVHAVDRPARDTAPEAALGDVALPQGSLA